MIASERIWGAVIEDRFAQKLMAKAGYDDFNRVPPGVGQVLGQNGIYIQHFEFPDGNQGGMYVLACGHNIRYRTKSAYFPRALIANGISPFPCSICEGGAA